jgi:hypothetical protein
LMCLPPYQRQDSLSYSPIWIMRRSGLTTEGTEVKKKVVDLVNNFIKDYASENPHAQVGEIAMSWQRQGVRSILESHDIRSRGWNEHQLKQ